MNATVVKKTQESLGKVIKKPQLSEKYLSKPPFRFLHDIFTEVIRTTGFMKGLYTDEEMKSDNIKEREAKMVFLQKAVDLVVLVTGEPLSVKPARVVAGQEAEKTNELLQAIALCCLNKRSSSDAVRRVLSGDKASERQREEEEPRGAEGKSKRRTEESREKHKNGETEQRQKGQREKEKRDERGEEREKREERGKERERGDERRKERERGKEREKRDERGKERDRQEERGEERERKEKREEREKSKEKTRSADRDKEREKEREKEKEKERERKRRDKDQDRTRSKPREEDPQAQVKSEEPPQNISPEEPPKPVAESSTRIPRPSSAKGQRRRATVGSQDESDSEGDADVAHKVPDTSAEGVAGAASSRRTVRPSSARAAPPRGKRRDSHAEADRLCGGKVSALILDGEKPEDEENDEDEQFLVQEAVAAVAEAPEAQTEATEASHGGLVKKILETKKYYDVSPTATKAQPLVHRQEQDLVQREMERLQASVQTVCRSALPLGKIMDYIQEDVDAMSAELQQWRQENQEHAQALQEETRLTEGALLPLRAELSELDSLIQEQQAQICALRCSILKNDERIHKMLTGLHHH